MNKLLLSMFLICYWASCLGTVDYWQHADEFMKQDKLARKKYLECSKNIANTYQLPLNCGDGIGTIVEGTDTIWCSKYIVHGKQYTIEDFKPIILPAIQYLWNSVRGESSFQSYLDCKAFPNKEIPLTINYIGMRIDFWDPNNNRYKYPYLSQVVFKEGKIHYFYADPVTQALVKPGVVEELPEWVLGQIEEK